MPPHARDGAVAVTDSGTASIPPPLDTQHPVPAGRLESDDAVRAAAQEVGLPLDIEHQVRKRLGDTIPPEVIKRELPWILRDIGVGQNLAKRHGP